MKGVLMLNDPTIQGKRAGVTDRRNRTRRDLSTEIVVRWHGDPTTPIRYRTADCSATGLRFESSIPILEGMTGSLHAMVPSDDLVDSNIMVAWSRPRRDGHGYDVGARYF
jgi:hypothetical protein